MALAPDRLILRPKTSGAFLRFLVCFAFAGCSVWWLIAGPAKDQFTAWGGLALFGMGSVIFASHSLPSANFIELSLDGLMVCAQWRSQLYKWASITQFSLGCLEGGADLFVVFYHRPENGEPKPGQKPEFQCLNNGYGMTEEELANLLEQWRVRHSPHL